LEKKKKKTGAPPDHASSAIKSVTLFGNKRPGVTGAELGKEGRKKRGGHGGKTMWKKKCSRPRVAGRGGTMTKEDYRNRGQEKKKKQLGRSNTVQEVSALRQKKRKGAEENKEEAPKRGGFSQPSSTKPTKPTLKVT